MAAWDSKNRRGPDAPRGPAEKAAAFRNLCRSSPWKWQSLRFEYLDRPLTLSAGSPTPPSPADVIGSTTGINDSRGGFYVSSTRKTWLLPPHLVTPVYDDDGLVRRRPEAAYGEPSFGNGRFAAVLDPVELAGNAPVPLEFPNSNAVELGPITEVDHEGRPALESTVSPNPSYRPADPGAPLCRPGRTLLRIDAATGVCVASRWLDAPGTGTEQDGYGHWLRILGVDEYMLDDLFLAESMNLTDVRRHISWDVPAE